MELTQEQYFNKYLESIIEGKPNFHLLNEKLNFQMKVSKYDLAIDHNIANIITSLQNDMYTLYALAKNNNTNIAELSQQEKNALHLIFNIEKGSIEIKVDIAQIIVAFGEIYFQLPESNRNIFLVVVALAFISGISLYIYDLKIKSNTEHEFEKLKIKNENKRITPDNLAIIIQAIKEEIENQESISKNNISTIEIYTYVKLKIRGYDLDEKTLKILINNKKVIVHYEDYENNKQYNNNRLDISKVISNFHKKYRISINQVTTNDETILSLSSIITESEYLKPSL